MFYIKKVLSESQKYPVIMIDNKGFIVHYNRPAMDIFFPDLDNVSGFSYIDLVYNGRKYDLEGNYLSPLVKTIETGIPVEFGEERLFSKLRGWETYYYTTSLVRIDTGSITGAQAVLFPVREYSGQIKETIQHVNAARAFAGAINSRDSYTGNHSERVSDMSGMLAFMMGFSRRFITMICLAGLLHDVGKISVPREILVKNGKLTGDEISIVRMHSRAGADIVSRIPSLNSLVPVVLHHHERYDGEGYPTGLSGEEIPVMSRIIAVGDAFDAMVSARSYRSKFTPTEAIREVIACAGGQFDPEVASTLEYTINNDEYLADYEVYKRSSWWNESGQIFPTGVK